MRRHTDIILSCPCVCSPHLNQYLLSRWEVVALLNVLHRFSESLHATEDFRRMWNERKAADGRVGASSVLTTKPDRDTIPSGSSVSQHESISQAPNAQPLRSQSHLVTLSPSVTNTTTKAAVQIQNLGRTFYEACKRSTAGCLNILSGFTQSVLRRFTDWDGGEGRTNGGDL